MNLYAKKRNYFARNVLLSLAGLGVFTFVAHALEQPIKNAALALSAPVARTFWQAGASSSAFTQGLFGATIQAENSNLKQENEKLAAQIVALQSMVRQNQTAAQFAEVSAGQYSTVQAQAIGLQGQGDVVTINKGSVDGIAENMPVVSAQNILYGKISQVYKNFSLVTLISSMQSALDVKIQAEDPAAPAVHGVVKGSGALGFYLDVVPLDAKMHEGDILSASGLDSVYPPGVLVGKILEVQKDDTKPFQTAKVQPFFNAQAIDNLFVITNYKR